MTPWNERPPEVANLLNPAFCGLLLRAAVAGYTEGRSEGMPFALIFLILPLVMHMGTRDSLPRTVRTSLISWLQDNAELRVEIDARVRNTNPYTKESLIFLMHRGLISVTNAGTLRSTGGFVGTQGIINKITRGTDEVAACANKAQFIGRWFSQSGEATTIFALFGIRP